jgi:DNA-binding NtrC family response regulator
VLRIAAAIRHGLHIEQTVELLQFSQTDLVGDYYNATSRPAYSVTSTGWPRDYLMLFEKGEVITPASLPHQTIKMFQIETIEPDKVRTIEELNKDYAEKILEMYGDNKSKAAEVLGISRTSLWRILKGKE